MKTKLKTILRLSVILLATSLMSTGCSKEDISNSDDKSLSPLILGTGGRQVSELSEGLSSRTMPGGNKWHSSDEIGVFMVSTQGTLPGNILSESGVAADNIKHSTTPHSTDASKASFEPLNNNEIIYYPKTGKVDIIAYHPHCVYGNDAGKITSDCIYNIDITDQNSEAKQVGIDMLYAKKVGIERSEAIVDLEFGHVMSKITLYIKAGNGVNISDISGINATDVLFKGMPVTAEIDLTDGACSSGNVSEGTVFSPLKAVSAPESYQASFTAILIPQAINEYTGRSININVGNRDYILEIPDTDVFAAGNHYTYQISVNKTNIIINSIDIVDWNLTLQEEVGVRAPGIYTSDDLVAFSSQWNATVSLTGADRKTAQNAVIADWSDNGQADGVIRVRADIDMSNVVNFAPIGSRTMTDNWGFTGTFDGGHFTISNLNVNRGTDNYAGLFGNIAGGKIRDVILDNCDITGNYHVGGISGSSSASSLISNCFVTGIKIMSNQNNAGGIVGNNDSGSIISGCVAQNITVATKANRSGGITGFNNGGIVSGCTMTGSYVTADQRNAAGIVGENNNGGVIDNCQVNGGSMTANITTGGIVGWNTGLGSEIQGCHVENAIMVSKDIQAGGIVGLNSSYAAIRDCSVIKTTIKAETDESGGIAGQNATNCIISGCLVTDISVTAVVDDGGGIAGQNNVGTIDNCRVENTTVTTNGNNAGGITGENSSDSYINGCSVTGTNITASYNSGGIAGLNYGSISGCPVSGGTLSSNQYSGGIVGYNNNIISACLVTGSTITANQSDCGGIAGYNYTNAIIVGCVSSPDEINADISKGVVIGNNEATVTTCYWGILGSLNAVGSGEVTDCGSFIRIGFGNFFDIGIVSTPIEAMNASIQSHHTTTPYRWESGGFGNYPITYKLN